MTHVHEEMAATIVGASLVVIEQCAHLPAMGQPKLVSEAIRVWLRGIEQA